MDRGVVRNRGGGKTKSDFDTAQGIRQQKTLGYGKMGVEWGVGRGVRKEA